MMRIWNKRLAGTCLALLIAVFTISVNAVFFVSAAGGLPRLVDMADLLSDSEEEELSALLNEISERQQVDVVVVAVDSMEGKAAEAYGDDFFDYNGYGYGDERDGILLVLGMEERECYISTSGYGITAITDAGREYIMDAFVNDLSLDDYAAAFTEFANLCDDFITQAKTGTPYDVDNLPGDTAGFFIGSFLISFGIGLIISLIVTGAMKGQLKTVSRQSKADTYMRPESLQLTKQTDLFLYSRVERRKKEEEKKNTSSTSSSSSGSSGGSKTHTSSSGRTHGGGGRKF